MSGEKGDLRDELLGPQVRRGAQWLTTARRMAKGTRTGPDGTGWGIGVVVKIQPAPEAGVTVDAIKTNCKWWAGGSIMAERKWKGGRTPGPTAPEVSREPGLHARKKLHKCIRHYMLKIRVKLPVFTPYAEALLAVYLFPGPHLLAC